MQESPQAKAAQDALRSEFAGKQKELQTQQQSLKSQGRRRCSAIGHDDGRPAHRGREATCATGNRELQQKVNEYQDDFNARQNEELSKLQKILVEEVQTVRPGAEVRPGARRWRDLRQPGARHHPAGAHGPAGAWRRRRARAPAPRRPPRQPSAPKAGAAAAKQHAEVAAARSHSHEHCTRRAGGTLRLRAVRRSGCARRPRGAAAVGRPRGAEFSGQPAPGLAAAAHACRGRGARAAQRGGLSGSGIDQPPTRTRCSPASPRCCIRRRRCGRASIRPRSSMPRAQVDASCEIGPYVRDRRRCRDRCALPDRPGLPDRAERAARRRLPPARRASRSSTACCSASGC